MFIASSVKDDLSTLPNVTSIRIDLTRIYTSANLNLPTDVTHMDLFLHHAHRSNVEIDRKVLEVNKEMDEDQLINRIDSVETLLSYIFKNGSHDSLIEVYF